MKISLIQENLAKALLHISKAVSSRPNIPVLANVLLETEKARLKLSATNLEIGVNTWIGANIEQEGKITVSAKLLSDFVNSLKPGKLELFMDQQSLVVKSVDNQAQFFIIPAEDFPSLPEVEGEPILEINAQEFANAISQTHFAASTDESKPVLTGILMEATKNELCLVAVDGFRLSKKIIHLPEELKQDIQEIIPARAMLEVQKLVDDIAKENDKIKVYYLGSKNQMLFKIGDVELSTRLIEGKFPDYKQILPSAHNRKLKIDKQELANTLKVVTIFARNVIGNKAKFQIDSEAEKMTLSANVIDMGSNLSTVKVKSIEGEDIETAFNVKFLSDMVNSISSEEIIFESNGPEAPGVFLDNNDKDYIHVIMPMRVE